MTSDDDAFGITPVFGNVPVHPGEGGGDIAGDIFHRDLRQQSVTGGDKDETMVEQRLRFFLDVGFIARLPAATVNPKDDREFIGLRR